MNCNINCNTYSKIIYDYRYKYSINLKPFSTICLGEYRGGSRVVGRQYETFTLDYLQISFMSSSKKRLKLFLLFCCLPGYIFLLTLRCSNSRSIVVSLDCTATVEDLLYVCLDLTSKSHMAVKPKLLVLFVAICTIGIMIVGCLFNTLQTTIV